MSEVNQFKFEGTIQKVFETKQGLQHKNFQWKAVEFLVTEKKEYPQSAVLKYLGLVINWKRWITSKISKGW